MKVLGIIFLVLAALNLIVAFVAIASNAPLEAITMKFNTFVLLAVIGGALYYFGKKNKQSKKDIMYCKHCGKQIADDSTFCQYCGGKLDVQTDNSEHSHIEESIEEKAETETPAQEVIVTTKETQPIQVEVSKKSTENSSTIANEIVGNLKMVGFALIGWIIFMIGFVLVHQKDIQQHPDSYWGESCYDETWIPGNYGSFDWKEILSQYKIYRTNEKRGLMLDGRPCPYSRTGPLIKLYDKSDEELEKEAKEEAQKNRDAFSEFINNHRKWEYEDDRKEKAKYSAIILLAFFIVGRYIVKLAKWTDKNKTE